MTTESSTQAGASAPEPPAAATRSPLAVTAGPMLDSVKHGLLASGAGLLVALVLGSLVLGMLPVGARKYAGDTLKDSILLWLASFRVPLDAVGAALVGAGSATVTVLIPLLVLATSAPVWWLGRRAETRKPSPDAGQMLAAALYAGGAAGAVALLAAIVSRQDASAATQVGGFDLSGSISVSANPALALICVAVFTAAAALTGRLADARARTVMAEAVATRAPWTRAWVSAARTGLEQTLALGAVTTVAALVYLPFVDGDFGQKLTVALLAFPAYYLAGGFILTGQPFTVATGSSNSSLFSSGSGSDASALVWPWSASVWLLVAGLVVGVLAAAFAGARAAVRTAPAQRIDLPEAGRRAVVVAFLAALLGLMTSASLGYSMSAVVAGTEASASYSANLLPGLLLPAAWGAASVALGWWLAPYALERLGGRGARVLGTPDPAWYGAASDTDAADAGTGSPAAPPATGVPTRAAVPAATLAVTRAPLSRRTKTLLAAGAIGAVVILAAVVGVRAVSGTLYSPTRTVSAYFDALAAGDAAGALAQVQDAPSGPLLTDAALAAARQSGTLSAVEVGDPIEGEDGTVRVPVSYTLVGEQFNDVIHVTRTGSTLLVFPTWSMTLGTATIEAALYDASIPTDVLAKASVDGTSVDLTVPQPAFPGAHTIVSGDPMFAVTTDGSSSSVTVAMGEVPVMLDASLSSEYTVKLSGAVTDSLAACSQPQPDVSGCPTPISTEDLGDATSVSRTLSDVAVGDVLGWQGRTVTVGLSGTIKADWTRTNDPGWNWNCSTAPGGDYTTGPWTCSNVWNLSASQVTFGPDGSVAAVAFNSPSF